MKTFSFGEKKFTNNEEVKIMYLQLRRQTSDNIPFWQSLQPLIFW